MSRVQSALTQLEKLHEGKLDIYSASEIARVANRHAAQQSVYLTALRRGLALSILFNVVLLAVVAFTIGGR